MGRAILTVPRGGLCDSTQWMPRKHDLDPKLPLELDLFFLVGRTDSRGCSLWGSARGFFVFRRGLRVSGSQYQDQMVVLWVKGPAQAVCEQKSCLEKLVTQQGVQFFKLVWDGLPAWKWHILEMAESHVAEGVECWGECGQAMGGPGGPLEGD